jgi:hypothetical protein
MTAIVSKAKQSGLQRGSGSMRRFAPRYDGLMDNGTTGR